jgi:hypothetical protein
MKKGIFSKIIVVFCVAEMAFMQYWAMSIAETTSEFLVTPLLTANHAVFGGELLLLCLKKLLTNDKEETKTKKNNTKIEEEI